MAQGDVTLREPGVFSVAPTKRYATAASATIIYAGEPIYQATSEDAVVVKAASLYPKTGTPKFVGIAQGDSTNTSALAGFVDVYDAISMPGQVYLCAPLSAAAIDTQAEYNALVGERCAFDLTSGVFTVQTTSAAATDGLVIVPSDITDYPNKVAFEIRPSACEKY
jgi:dTDP-4-dehydrorhamnose reductase